MKTWLVTVALVAMFALLSPSSWAQGKGQGKGKDKSSGQAASEDKSAGKQEKAKHKEKNSKADKEKDKDRAKGWESREGYEYRTYGEAKSRPPGWSKGKKTGWDNCGVPPGQAKKGECRTYTYQGRRHYYYYDEQGRMQVRRAAETKH